MTWLVLDASDDELERRVRAWEIGSGAEDQLTRTSARARRFRARNAASPHVLDTTAVDVADLAGQAIERAGWASPTAAPGTPGGGLQRARAAR